MVEIVSGELRKLHTVHSCECWRGHIVSDLGPRYDGINGLCGSVARIVPRRVLGLARLRFGAARCVRPYGALGRALVQDLGPLVLGSRFL